MAAITGKFIGNGWNNRISCVVYKLANLPTLFSPPRSCKGLGSFFFCEECQSLVGSNARNTKPEIATNAAPIPTFITSTTATT